MKTLQEVIVEKLKINKSTIDNSGAKYELTKLSTHEIDIEYLAEQYDEIGFGNILYWQGSEPDIIGVFVFLHDYEGFAYFNDKVNITTNNDKTLSTYINGNSVIKDGCAQVQEIFKLIRGHVDTNIQTLVCADHSELEYFLDELPKAEDWKYAKNLSEFLNDTLGTETTPDDFYAK